ncbi:MAG: hypothetical protein WCE81_03850 [Halobacteriota archaeon]
MAEETNAAFLLSLISGVLILMGGFVVLGLGLIGSLGMIFTPMMGHMTGYMMGGFWFLGWVSYIAAAIGIVSGIIVLYGAFTLRSRPEERTTWGALILTFSLISLLGSGGFLIGAILGILGGVLALAER